MKTVWYFAIFVIVSFIGCASDEEPGLRKIYPKSFTLTVKNEANLKRIDAAVTFDLERLLAKAPDFNPEAFVITHEETEIASQLIDLDTDGEYDGIIAVSDFGPRETKRLTLHYAKEGRISRAYTKRTQAELSHKVGGRFMNRVYEGGTFQNVASLRVPPEHTDHSLFVRYEGPGWESDKVGYRFYLDWRNAIDIFGKKVPEMVLQDVGLDGFESYHEMADWGMDVFKVGNSLGVGSFGIWYQDKANRVEKTDSITCTITANGPLFSQIQTIYYGWDAGSTKAKLTSELSILAGSRLTHCHLLIDGTVDNICTGLAKHEGTVFLKRLPERPEAWGYIALWGRQSLAAEDDQLGIAVLYQGRLYDRITEDDLNYAVVLTPDAQSVDYYFLAAWDQEPNGITSKEEFETYLAQTITELNNPLHIVY